MCRPRPIYRQFLWFLCHQFVTVRIRVLNRKRSHGFHFGTLGRSLRERRGDVRLLPQSTLCLRHALGLCRVAFTLVILRVRPRRSHLYPSIHLTLQNVSSVSSLVSFRSSKPFPESKKDVRTLLSPQRRRSSVTPSESRVPLTRYGEKGGVESWCEVWGRYGDRGRGGVGSVWRPWIQRCGADTAGVDAEVWDRYDGCGRGGVGPVWRPWTRSKGKSSVP